VKNNQKLNSVQIVGILTAILVAIVIGVFAIVKIADNKSSGNTPSSYEPTLSGGTGTPPATGCTSDGACSNLDNSPPAGCSANGPCSQTSDGNIMVLGAVTAVTDTSITLKSDSGTKTYILSSSTKLARGGNTTDTTYSHGQIKVGDSIGLTLSSDGATIVTVMIGIHSDYKSGQ
jgi:hypothetical protein